MIISTHHIAAKKCLIRLTELFLVKKSQSTYIADLS